MRSLRSYEKKYDSEDEFDFTQGRYLKVPKKSGERRSQIGVTRLSNNGRPTIINKNRFNPLDMFKNDGNPISVAATDLSAHYRGPKDKKYIIIAFFAALFFGLSQVIRGVASSDIFSTKMGMSIVTMILSSFYFLYQKIMAKRKNEVFYAPWYTAQLGTFKSLRVLLSGT